MDSGSSGSLVSHRRNDLLFAPDVQLFFPPVDDDIAYPAHHRIGESKLPVLRTPSFHLKRRRFLLPSRSRSLDGGWYGVSDKSRQPPVDLRKNSNSCRAGFAGIDECSSFSLSNQASCPRRKGPRPVGQ